MVTYVVSVNLQENEYCIGWQNSKTLPSDERETILLGGTVFIFKQLCNSIHMMT